MTLLLCLFLNRLCDLLNCFVISCLIFFPRFVNKFLALYLATLYRIVSIVPFILLIVYRNDYSFRILFHHILKNHFQEIKVIFPRFLYHFDCNINVPYCFTTLWYFGDVFYLFVRYVCFITIIVVNFSCSAALGSVVSIPLLS